MYRRHANYWLSTASSGGPRFGTHVLYNNHELAEPSSRPSRLSNLARFCPAGGSHLNQWANIPTAEPGYVCTCVPAYVLVFCQSALGESRMARRLKPVQGNSCEGVSGALRQVSHSIWYGTV